MKPVSTHGAEEGSYLASVADLMSGLLFVFIIALVVFALGLKQQQELKALEVKRLQGAGEERKRLLETLRLRLEEAGIRVDVSPDQGVLRLGESILFDLGSADLDDGGRNAVRKLADVFASVLPCYTVAPPELPPIDCGDRGQAGQIDAIFIEGHTDDRPFSGSGGFRDNWELSSARAEAIYKELTNAKEFLVGVPAGAGLTQMLRSRVLLDGLKNQDGQQVLSVSAYADRRGIKPNDNDEHRKLNRRIDLRFVMVPPRELLPEPAERTRERLSS